MSPQTIALIYFFYGLAFFSMGLAITLEIGHATQTHTRFYMALRPLAAFGFIHGVHEWIEMLILLELLPGQMIALEAWDAIRLGLLAFSFISLAAFGAMLVTPGERLRVSLIAPLVLTAIWGFGLLIMRGQHAGQQDLWDVADVWTRYALAIPAALLASAGLITQQRAFRQAGMARFGRDALWAAVAFAWYGIIGQLFTRESPLPPSTFINQALFFELFGFPVQLLRAITAGLAAFFVMRFLRSFEVEVQRRIAELQSARLQEAEERETLRGELLRRVVAAQETERQRIARELHDETGQALTAIGLGLRGVSTTLHQDADRAGSNLRQLERLVTHSLGELRRMIADLRPSHLDDLGLPAALRWYAGEIESRAPLKVVVEVQGEPESLPSPVKIALFRVIQEALNNVLKHADADHVYVTLYYNQDHVGARVQDDGCGFDVDMIAMASRPSWGLLGMRERASLLGGQFSINSYPGEGTVVEVSLPYGMPEEGVEDDSTAAGG